MNRPLSPIHAPISYEEIDPLSPTGRRQEQQSLDSANPTANPPAAPQPHARIVRLAELDSRVLAGRQHKIGPGGASTVFARAVDKALTEELAAQLRSGEGTYGKAATRELRNRGELSEIGSWAADIIDAFSEE